MLSDCFEDFVRLLRVRRPDGLGGIAVSWENGATVRAGLFQSGGTSVSLAEAPAYLARCTVLHDRALELHTGDRLRRVRDGAIFRVLGNSADHRAPDHAALSLAQVPAERLVSAS
jgi:hypothetical protein